MKKKILARVLKYTKKYRLLIGLSILLALFTVGLTLYIPVLTGDAIDLIIGRGNVNFEKIAVLLIEIGVTVGVCALAQWLMSVINNKIVYGVVSDMRNDAMTKIQTLPLSYLDSHSTGDMVGRMITDVDRFSEGLIMGFSQLFTGCATIAATLAFIAVQSVFTAVAVVVITPVSLLVASRIAKQSYVLFKDSADKRGVQSSFVEEYVGQIKTVKAFSQEKSAVEIFDEQNEELRKSSLKAVFVSSLTNPSTRFVNALVYAAVGLAGALSVINGQFSVGRFSCLLSYANQYTKPFNDVSGVIAEMQNALACAARVFELLDEKSESPDAPRLLENTDHGVSVENVSFSYTADKKLIENYSMKAEKGKRIAIVGPTGCGKTTLINLLMRFYDVNAGKICVDGIDIRDVTRSSLRACYGMVLQDTWLKSGTIRQNIAFGRENASDEEIIEAAKKAHAHGFITQLENGYDTVIGEDGGSLSQGQKQLLCICRVMLALPPMLILDEATSSIDTRTEIKIRKAFDEMMNSRTSFIVAHRLSTIRGADEIIVMNNGNIVETGTHEKLIEQNGFYARLYKEWQGR